MGINAPFRMYAVEGYNVFMDHYSDLFIDYNIFVDHYNDALRQNMYPNKATIEVYRCKRWQPAGTLHPDNPEQGYRGESSFEYLLDYAANCAGPGEAPAAGLSCRYPVDFDLHRQARWPAFILDILPSGYGRRQWLEQLELNDGPRSEWPLLMRGTAFPPGNLRIAEAVAAKDPSRKVPTSHGDLVPAYQHPGFERDDILVRDEYFIEYAYQLGISEFGMPVPHDTLCQAIIRYCSDPKRDLLEYIKRDIANVVLGNKDNHSRNSAVIRHEEGHVALAPLFDFAPMYLDPEGIARVCRWEGDAENAGRPEWAVVIERFKDHLDAAKPALRQFGQEIARLPDTMRLAGVDDTITEHCAFSIEYHSRQLMTL